MNAQPDRPGSVRKFNPGTLQSDEEVKRQFVVRQPKLDIVLEVLRGNVDSPSCQHVLIVAPRGRGKTMLLARVAAELRTDGALSERLLPVRFMEESQEIFTLADFWLEALFHLARESRQYDPEIARELQDAHAELAAGWRGRAWRRAPAPPSWRRRIGSVGSSCSWSRTCKRCARASTTTSAGSFAGCCSRSPRSSCSPLPPVVSGGLMMRGSRSSSCSESPAWSRWTPGSAGACGGR